VCRVLFSPGWDRTAQLVSLAQLLLDPFYRTMRGFFVLLCAQWLSFGHKLTERLGHGGLGGRENSPVLAQFFDCVFQLISQHPTRFEFKDNMLLALRHSLHSGKYGTWMGNSEAEREKLEWERISSHGLTASAATTVAGADASASAGARLRDSTPSVFTQLWRYRSEFLNPAYEFAPGSGRPFEDYTTPNARNNPLSFDLTQLRFWKEYYQPSTACVPVGAECPLVQPNIATQIVQPVAFDPAAAVPVATTSISGDTPTNEQLMSQLAAQRAAHDSLLAQQRTAEAAHVRVLSAQVAAQDAALQAAQRAQDDALAAQREIFEARLAEQAAMLEQSMSALAAFTAAAEMTPAAVSRQASLQRSIAVSGQETASGAAASASATELTPPATQQQQQQHAPTTLSPAPPSPGLSPMAAALAAARAREQATAEASQPATVTTRASAPFPTVLMRTSISHAPPAGSAYPGIKRRTTPGPVLPAKLRSGVAAGGGSNSPATDGAPSLQRAASASSSNSNNNSGSSSGTGSAEWSSPSSRNASHSDLSIPPPPPLPQGAGAVSMPAIDESRSVATSGSGGAVTSGVNGIGLPAPALGDAGSDQSDESDDEEPSRRIHAADNDDDDGVMGS